VIQEYAFLLPTLSHTKRGRYIMLYVYNMHNIVEKHFSISIGPVWSLGGLLVSTKTVLKDEFATANLSRVLERSEVNYYVYTKVNILNKLFFNAS
jgi:hypothetical protein